MTTRRIAVFAVALALLAALAAWMLRSESPSDAPADPTAGDERPAVSGTAMGVEPTKPPPSASAPLPPESLPLQERLRALEALARAGHAEANCRVAVERLRCARLASWQPGGYEQVREAELEAEGKLEQANELASQTLLRISQKQACEAAGVRSDGDLLALLAPAAASGHGPAAVLYFEAGRSLRHGRGIYEHPAFDAWRRDAARHLQAAFDAGVPEAAHSLMMAYWTDGDFASGLVPDDPRRAWFHLVLSNELFGHEFHPDNAKLLGLGDAETARITAEATAFRRERFGDAMFVARAMDAESLLRQPGLVASDICGPPMRL